MGEDGLNGAPPAPAWTCVYEVTAEVSGCFTDQDYEDLFRAALRRFSADPQVRAIRGCVLTSGSTNYAIAGDVPNVTGFKIDVQWRGAHA
jgi:hypothetical protein